VQAGGGPDYKAAVCYAHLGETNRARSTLAQIGAVRRSAMSITRRLRRSMRQWAKRTVRSTRLSTLTLIDRSLCCSCGSFRNSHRCKEWLGFGNRHTSDHLLLIVVSIGTVVKSAHGSRVLAGCG